MTDDLEITPLVAGDAEHLFDLFARVVGAGEGYPHAAPLTHDVFHDTWIHHTSVVVCARLDGRLVGAYYLKPNQPGRASHIANAGYITDSAVRGRGIGRRLVTDSITRAPQYGYDAIQFNLVFESNPARAMYEELGWQQIGRVPRAVNGEPAIIYWRDV
jgi:GNAT superfamily N-acetyltransferase